MIYLITRHVGARQWLQEVVNQPYVPLVHLQDASFIKAGDIVVGTLPVNLIAQINSLGARYFHLHINLPAHLRGQELTAEQLVQLGACLVEYSVHKHE